MTQKIRERFGKFIKVEKFQLIYGALQTFYIFILVCFAWIFFRANKLSDAIYIVSNLFNGIGEFIANITNFFYVGQVLSVPGSKPDDFIAVFIFIAILIFIQILKGRRTIRAMLINAPTAVRWCFYYFMIFAILWFGNFGEQPFIYFQF